MSNDYNVTNMIAQVEAMGHRIAQLEVKHEHIDLIYRIDALNQQAARMEDRFREECAVHGLTKDRMRDLEKYAGLYHYQPVPKDTIDERVAQLETRHLALCRENDRLKEQIKEILE